jgi:hypothetical protein
MQSFAEQNRSAAATVEGEFQAIYDDIREGRFERGLALMAGLSSILSGLEVGYEHYRAGYGNPIMYSPVLLSGVLTGVGIWASFGGKAGRKALRITSAITLLDSVSGFCFHIRGIQRKPGGWRIPIVNIVMGPPIFAPLLFGTSAYLGLLGSYMRRGDAPESDNIAARQGAIGTNWKQELREGRFQKHVAAVTVFWSFFSGFEACYSHYKNNFKYKVQWTPVLLTPVLMATAAASIPSRTVAKKILPAVSIVTIANGSIGFYYHARGIVRRPGGLKQWIYNVMYGPPIFAPLLFAACGTLGLLASILRREPK